MKFLQIYLVILFFSLSNLVFCQIPTDGLSLWLSADTGVVIENGFVKEWKDRSGNGNNLSTSIGSGATFFPSIDDLNKKTTLRFDGSSAMTSANGVTFGSVYVICKFATAGNFPDYNGLLANKTFVTPYYIFVAQAGTSTLMTGLPNFAIDYVKCNGVVSNNISPINEYSLLYATTSNKTVSSLTGITLGATSDGIPSRRWNGDVAEIIIFSKALYSAEQSSVEQYLFNKYAPHKVALGNDTVLQSFCPFTIRAGKQYAQYKWNDGSTADSLIVTKTGKYAVTVIDKFGQQSSDSVLVSFPTATLSIRDTTICAGLQLRAFVQKPAGFTHTWQNGSTADTLLIENDTSVWAKIYDGDGCSIQTDTAMINLDRFSKSISLGNDTSLCTGVILSLQKQDPLNRPTQYKWMDGSTDTAMIISNVTDYSLTTQNARGCMANDTIKIKILGSAPQFTFNCDAVCLGDSSWCRIKTNDAFDSVRWKLPNNKYSTTIAQKILLPQATSYTIGLRIYSNICANYKETAVIVKPKPSVSLNSGASCAGFEVKLSANIAVDKPDTIAKYNWLIDSKPIAAKETANIILASIGTHQAQLSVLASNGCFDSTSLKINTIGTSTIPSIETILPKEMVESNKITFSWKSTNTIFSILEIATDQTFTKILFADSVWASDTTVNVSLQNNETIYWRVHCFNLCHEKANSKISQTRFFDPRKITDLSLWLSADTGVVIENGFVKEWKDRSGNGNNAIQTATDKQAVLENDISDINNKAALRFDGENDFMEFPELTSIRTAFFLIKHATGTAVGYPAILGHPSRYDWIGDNGIKLFSVNYISPNTKNGDFYLNANKTEIENINKPINYAIVSTITKDNTAAQYITNDRNVSGRCWQGDYAEILLYNKALNSAERSSIEKYLFHKYAPPKVALGKDTVLQSFCPLAIHAGKQFAQYKWNNGSTADSLIVTKTGKYDVTVIDKFGQQSSDSVLVSFPTATLSIRDTTICAGLQLRAFVQKPAGFTHTWQNGSTDDTLRINNDTSVWAKIDDGAGCSIMSDTAMVKLDRFAQTTSLGNDTSLCAGNKIKLITNASQARSYLWSNAAQSPELTIQNSGTYSLTVNNINNCIARDTITISIKGIAPKIKINIPKICQDTKIQISDLSTSSDNSNILSREWTIGTAHKKTQIIDTVFKNSTVIEAKLKVVAESQCSADTNFTLIILPRPIAQFTPHIVCQGTSLKLIDKTKISSGVASAQMYIYKKDSSAAAEAEFTFNTAGIDTIKQISVADNGCADTAVTTIEVRSVPKLHIAHSSLCIKQDVLFYDSTEYETINPILTRNWLINGRTFNNYKIVNRYFSSPQTVDVQLTVKTVNGCTSTASKQFTTQNTPIAGFIVPKICAEQQAQLIDTSSIVNDSIVNYLWYITKNNQSIGRFTKPQPLFVCKDSGTYNITLQVQSKSECSSSAQHSMYVAPKPQANFMFNPLTGGWPLEVNFDNKSIGAENYEWNFGDDEYSKLKSPEHTYYRDGQFTIQLLATSNQNCTDTVQKSIKVLAQKYKIMLSNLQFSVENEHLNLQVDVANLGTNTIDSLQLDIMSNGGTSLREEWHGQLLTGENLRYKFAAHPKANKQTMNGYLRTVAQIVTNNETFSSDSICISMLETFTVFACSPNPANTQTSINYTVPEAGQLSFKICDLHGKSIQNFTINAEKGFNSFILNTSQFAAGYYSIHLNYKNTSANTSLIVLKKE